ncbi:IS110 family transposase [Nonomuraea sp. M3C6]|uniref:IS110 family transposase n=1 Tax=Nonomuraea marmarensis TaxID=3351344 RepID=A0ABW7AV73_9ACTN
MRDVEDEPLFVDRAAGLDIGKKEIEATIRVPSETRAGRRMSESRTFGTTHAELLNLADWLRSWQVSTVGMEATGDYWKPPFFVLEGQGFDCHLYNAGQVKALPGRPKTDRADSIWLAKIVERGMIASSFVPPEPIRRLRTHTRYRRSLVQASTSEKQRVEKLLEDAHLKLTSLISDLFGVSGRGMLQAIIGGQRDPKVLAQLARGRMRMKIAALEQALDCSFLTEEHVAVLQMMLVTIDHYDRQIAALTATIEQLIEPYTRQVEQLDEIPGIGTVGAADIIAEIGVDMSVFATPAHLVSWAKFAPQVKKSAGKRKGSNATGRGNPYLAAALGEAAIGAGNTQSFLGARYRRLNRRMPKKKALVATGNSQLVIIHALLSDAGARYQDLGADYYETRMHVRRQARNHVKSLERLGYKVTIESIAPDEEHLPLTSTG